jgi:hypothetical protein
MRPAERKKRTSIGPHPRPQDQRQQQRTHSPHGTNSWNVITMTTILEQVRALAMVDLPHHLSLYDI